MWNVNTWNVNTLQTNDLQQSSVPSPTFAVLPLSVQGNRLEQLLKFCPPASPQYESDESPSRSGVQWALDWRYERCCLWLCIMWLTLDSGPSKFVDSQSQDGFGCTLCNYIGAWQTQTPRSSWRDSRTFLQCGSASQDVMDFTPPAARVGWSDASRQAPHWHLMLTVANEKNAALSWDYNSGYFFTCIKMRGGRGGVGEEKSLIETPEITVRCSHSALLLKTYKK